jgi:hypothetical protein
VPGECLCYVCGVTDEVLFHNVRALVVDHDAVTRNVVFNDKLLALPSTGIPTTGVCAVSRSHQRQDRERRRNVKKNAIAGRCFAT